MNLKFNRILYTAECKLLLIYIFNLFVDHKTLLNSVEYLNGFYFYLNDPSTSKYGVINLYTIEVINFKCLYSGRKPRSEKSL